jgi:SUMO ligase MMS21 Smc5/6 complex component
MRALIIDLLVVVVVVVVYMIQPVESQGLVQAEKVVHLEMNMTGTERRCSLYFSLLYTHIQLRTFFSQLSVSVIVVDRACSSSLSFCFDC